MKVYISGALMASRDLAAARRSYEFAARCVEEAGHRAYVPHLHTDPVRDADTNAEDVFETDVRQLRDADLVIAFLDEPSLGVGAELAIATEAKVPILGLHRMSGKVSRFVVGLLTSHGNTVTAYSGGDDIRNAIIGSMLRSAGKGSW